MDRMENAYEVLGVSEDAPAEEVKTAYERYSKAFNPKLHDHQLPEVKDLIRRRFNQVKLAWDILGDAEKRKEYDRLLAAERTASAVSQPEQTLPVETVSSMNLRLRG